MKQIRIVLIFLLVLCMGLTFVSCMETDENSTTAPPAGATHTVSVSGEHVTFDAARKTVAAGETAVFSLTPEAGYEVASVSAGVYDAASGTLTVAGVSADTEITVTTRTRSLTVTLLLGEGASMADDEAVKTVKYGKSAVFYVRAASGRDLHADAGTYLPEENKLTISNVTEDMTVSIWTTAKGAASYSVTFAGEHIVARTGHGEAGQPITLPLEAEDGYMVVSVDGAVYDAGTGTVTIASLTADTVLTVTTAPAFSVSIAGEHITVTGRTEIRVAAGGTAVFSVAPEVGYEITAVSAGDYDDAAHTLTVSPVNADVAVTVTTQQSSVPVYTVALTSKAHMTIDSPASVQVVQGGTVVFDVTTDRGWGISALSAGALNDKGQIVVSNVTGNVTVTPSVNMRKTVYHLNDGTSAPVNETPDFSFYSAPNAKWDDGTLTRSGYVLIEYNTKADGSGQAYSLGSKVPYGKNAGELHLYCIWARETAKSSFTYSVGKVTVAGVQKIGVTITGYTGSDATVVIPEEIDGDPVLRIAAGAFVNRTAMTTLVMSKNIGIVASGAFTGCSNLGTLYFSDSIYSIPDDAFDAATYSNLHHFYLNATMAPRYTGSYDGMYRVKYDTILASEKPVIVILSGSSSVYGLSAEYFEALMGDEYTVVNYGTIRTTSMLLYLEGLKAVLGEGDILIYAPENSSAYTMGSGELNTFKIFRDTEGSYNLFRDVDIAHFSHYFSGISDYNNRRYGSSASSYAMYNVPNTPSGSNQFRLTYPDTFTIFNQHGDMVAANPTNKNKTGSSTNQKISFDDKTYSISEGEGAGSIAAVAPAANAALAALRAQGVATYFGFCPV
ncbi:MAG: leucine-rich repeat protein, partial [Clostridia bacterium]|nr:leucine-rich repeat protein [Clostridia bacterium]